jgi:hypothetical protein
MMSDERVIINKCGADGSFVGRQTWRWGGGFGWGMTKFSLGQAKNDGYQRAGRMVVSAGGRSRWGRINNSPLARERFVVASYFPFVCVGSK